MKLKLGWAVEAAKARHVGSVRGLGEAIKIISRQIDRRGRAITRSKVTAW